MAARGFESSISHEFIDATGIQLGSAIPQFPREYDPEKLRRAFLRTMAYTTPPGSGNAYSRDFVRNVFAFGPTIPQSDAVLLTIAPILGDVLTIRKPLARYRIHGASWGAMGESLNPLKLRQLLHQDIERARLFTTVSCQLGLPVSRDPLKDNFHHLQYRLASYLVEPSAHPFPEDTKASLVFRLMSSMAKSSQMGPRNRAILLAWTITCALLPQYYRRNLILWRFSAVSRPALVRTLLGTLSSLRSTPSRPGLKWATDDGRNVDGVFKAARSQTILVELSNACRHPVHDRCSVYSDRSLAIRALPNNASRSSPTLPFSTDSRSLTGRSTDDRRLLCYLHVCL